MLQTQILRQPMLGLADGRLGILVGQVGIGMEVGLQGQDVFAGLAF